MLCPANRVHTLRLESTIKVNYWWAIPSKVADFMKEKHRAKNESYMGTSLLRNHLPLGPYYRPMPRVLRES